MSRRTVLSLLAAAAAALSAGCGIHEPTLAASTPGDGETVVAVSRASRMDLARELTLTGELTPFQEVEVMAKVAGYVQRILVDVGSVVRRGDTLAVLEVPEMKDDLARASASIQRNLAEMHRAQEEIVRAETAHHLAHLTFSRLGSVARSRPGLVAQQELDDALARDQVAEAQIAAAKSALAASQEQIKVSEAEKGKAATLLEYTRVTAPFSGVVTWRYANVGSMIQAGVSSQSQAMPVVRLSQNDLLRLVLPVPESAAGQIRPGSTVEVRVPSLQRTFTGRISRTSGRVDATTRTMHAELDVPNPDRVLIPGMYAEAVLRLDVRKGAVVIPLAALDRSPEGDSILVVTPEGEVRPRRVAGGLENATCVEVKDGLREGEFVVLAGRSRLKPGQRVRIKEVEQPGRKAVS